MCLYGAVILGNLCTTYKLYTIILLYYNYAITHYTLFTGKQCCIASLLYKLFEVDITINGYCWAIKNKLKAFETDCYYGSKFPSLHSPLP